MEPSDHRHAQPSAPAADALSSLPTHLLDEILTRLDLCDIIRTSALSRAWRLRWESLPALSLSFLDRPDTPSSVVDRILVRYAGRISRFSFSLDYWLIALSCRGVESIDLRTSEKYIPFRLHSSIFSCRHLLTLDLHQCRFPSLPPGFAGFPSLEELNLTGVKFLDETDELAAIIRRSPLLRALKLHNVTIDYYDGDEWVIQAPNLRSVTIIAEYFYYWRFGELPRLADATIDMESYVEEHDFGKFLAGIAHVEKLTLSTCYEPYIGDNLLGKLPFTFDNLRSLFLSSHFLDMHAILSTFTLLRNAPNLKELEIKIKEGDGPQEIEANAEFQNAQWVDGMLPDLQIVRMSGICYGSNEMCFIEPVLSKATALRTMSISLGEECSTSSEDVLSKLNTYRRASPHAQVFFKV